jgi:hypothetical protein
MALNNVPLAGQTLGVTRVPINQNFSVIDTAFQVDHVDYNTIQQGMHNKTSFPTQSSIPAPQAGIVQLYSQVSAITGQPELVFTHQAGSTAPSAAQIVEFTSAGWTNPGWTRLPSGILLKWHSGIGFGGSGSVTINVNTDVPGSPNFTNLLTMQSTTLDSSASYNNVVSISIISFPNVTFSKFGGPNPGSSVTIAYLAIGI